MILMYFVLSRTRKKKIVMMNNDDEHMMYFMCEYNSGAWCLDVWW